MYNDPVLHTPVHVNAHHARDHSRVYHIDDTRLRPDTDQHSAAIFSDGEVIRPSAERDFLFNLSAFSIDYIEHALRFVADVNARSIGRESDVMRQLYASDYLHDVIGGGINHINSVASTVRDKNPSCRRR